MNASNKKRKDVTTGSSFLNIFIELILRYSYELILFDQLMIFIDQFFFNLFLLFLLFVGVRMISWSVGY